MEILTFDDDLGAIVSTTATMAPTAHGNDVFAAIFTSQRLVLLSVRCAAGDGVVSRETARFHWQAAHPMEAVTLSPDGADLLVVTSRGGPAYLLPVHMLLALHQKKKRNNSDDDASMAASKEGWSARTQAEELLYMNTALLPQANQSESKGSPLQDDFGLRLESVELDRSTRGEPSANSRSSRYDQKGERTSFSGSEAAETVLSDDVGLGDLEVEGSIQQLEKGEQTVRNNFGAPTGSPAPTETAPKTSPCCTWWTVLEDDHDKDSTINGGYSSGHSSEGGIDTSSISQVPTRVLAVIAHGARLTFYERVPLGFEDRLQLSLGSLGVHCPDGALPATTLVPVPISLENAYPVSPEHSTRWAMRLAAPVQSLASIGGPCHCGLLATCSAANDGGTSSSRGEESSNACNKGLGNSHAGGFVLSHTPRRWHVKPSADGSESPKPEKNGITYSNKDLPASPSSQNSAAEVQPVKPLYLGLRRLSLPPLDAPLQKHGSTTSTSCQSNSAVCVPRTLVPLVDGFQSEVAAKIAALPSPELSSTVPVAVGISRAVTVGVLSGTCLDVFCIPMPMSGDGTEWMAYDDSHANTQAGEQTDNTAGDNTDHEAAFSADIAAIMSALSGGNHSSLDAGIPSALHPTAPVHDSSTSSSSSSVDDLGTIVDATTCSRDISTPAIVSAVLSEAEQTDHSDVSQTITNGSVSFLGRVLLGSISGYGRGHSLKSNGNLSSHRSNANPMTVVVSAAPLLSRHSLPLLGVGSADGNVALAQPLWHLGVSSKQVSDSRIYSNGSGSSGTGINSNFPGVVACAPLAVDTIGDHDGGQSEAEAGDASHIFGMTVAGAVEKEHNSSNNNARNTQGSAHPSRGFEDIGVRRALAWTGRAVHFLEVPPNDLRSTYHDISAKRHFNCDAEYVSSSQLPECSSGIRAAWALREALTQAKMSHTDLAAEVAEAALFELYYNRGIRKQKYHSDSGGASISDGRHCRVSIPELNGQINAFEEIHSEGDISDDATIDKLLAARLASLLVEWELAALRKAEAFVESLEDYLNSAEAPSASPSWSSASTEAKTPRKQALENLESDEVAEAKAAVTAARTKLKAMVMTQDQKYDADLNQCSYERVDSAELGSLCARALVEVPFPVIALLVAGAEPAQAAAAAAVDETVAKATRASRFSEDSSTLSLGIANSAAVAAAIATTASSYTNDGFESAKEDKEEKVLNADDLASAGLFSEVPIFSDLCQTEKRPDVKLCYQRRRTLGGIGHLTPFSWSRSLGLRLAGTCNCVPRALEVIAIDTRAAAAAHINFQSTSMTGNQNNFRNSSSSTRDSSPLTLADVEWLLDNGWEEAFATAGNGELAWERPIADFSTEFSCGDAKSRSPKSTSCGKNSSSSSNEHDSGPGNQDTFTNAHSNEYLELALFPRALRLRACLSSPSALAPHRAWVRAALPTAAALDFEIKEDLSNDGSIDSSVLNGEDASSCCGGSSRASGSGSVLGHLTPCETDSVIDTLAIWCGLLNSAGTRSIRDPRDDGDGSGSRQQMKSDQCTLQAARWRSLGVLKVSTGKGAALPRASRGGPDDADMLLGCLMDLAYSSGAAVNTVHPSAAGGESSTLHHGNNTSKRDETHYDNTGSKTQSSTATQALEALTACCVALAGQYRCAANVGALADRGLWTPAAATLEAHGDWPLALEMRLNALVDRLQSSKESPEAPATSMLASLPSPDVFTGRDEVTEKCDEEEEGATDTAAKQDAKEASGENESAPKAAETSLALLLESHVLDRPAGEGGDGIWDLILDAWQCSALGPPRLVQFEALLLARIATEEAARSKSSGDEAVGSRTARRFMGFVLRRGRRNVDTNPDTNPDTDTTPSPSSSASVPLSAPACADTISEVPRFNSQHLPPFSRNFLLSVAQAAAAAATVSPESVAARNELEAQWKRAVSTLRDARGYSTSGTNSNGSFQAPSCHEAFQTNSSAITAARSLAQNRANVGRFAPATSSFSSPWSGSVTPGQAPAGLSRMAVFSCGHVLREDSLKATERALEFAASQNADAVSTITPARRQVNSMEAVHRNNTRAMEAQRLADLYRSRPVLGVACPECSGAVALTSGLGSARHP